MTAKYIPTTPPERMSRKELIRAYDGYRYALETVYSELHCVLADMGTDARVRYGRRVNAIAEDVGEALSLTELDRLELEP